MELTLNVRLDASEKFSKVATMVATAILATKMDKLPWEVEDEKPASEKKEYKPKPTNMAKKTEAPTSAPKKEDSAPADDLPFGEGYPGPGMEVKDETPKADPEKTCGKVEIRAAMQDARNRIEYPDGGEEYDESLHKQMTAAFKAIAKRIDDGKKPTELTGDGAKQFCEACEGIKLEDGKVCPF